VQLVDARAGASVQRYRGRGAGGAGGARQSHFAYLHTCIPSVSAITTMASRAARISAFKLRQLLETNPQTAVRPQRSDDGACQLV